MSASCFILLVGTHFTEKEGKALSPFHHHPKHHALQKNNFIPTDSSLLVKCTLLQKQR
jgi:hypothetical protein